MKHRKAQHTEKDFTPIITDDKVFLLRYNFVLKQDKGDKDFLEYDEILLTKNEYEYHKSLNGIDNNFITRFIIDNEKNVKIMKGGIRWLKV